MEDADSDSLDAAQGILYALYLSVPFWCIVFIVIIVFWK